MTTREIGVDSGEVAVTGGASVLRANAIGSCVVVAAYDPNAGVGGMAHVMLPGASRDPDPSLRTKYAEDAMQEMMRKMAALGADGSRVRVCLIGGANVLGNGDDSPGAEIVRSLNEILDRMGLAVVATEVGGMQRRSCTFDLPRRRVTCTVGDSEDRVLWEARLSCGDVSDTGQRYAPEGGRGVAT